MWKPESTIPPESAYTEPAKKVEKNKISMSKIAFFNILTD